MSRDLTTIKLSAEGTDAGDDGQGVKVTWWIYPEAGTVKDATLRPTGALTAEVLLPPAPQTGTVHVILQAEDEGTPVLYAYRRLIIQVNP